MLSYKRYGNKESPVPLVMIHGFLCSGKFFSPNIPDITEFVDVITVDLPGFGDSYDVPGAGTILEMAQNVLQTLEKMDCKNFHLLGHSMGGMVALQMALLAPERINKLIVYASNSDGNLPERFETFTASKERIKTMGANAAKKFICATWFRDGEAGKYFNLCLSCSDFVNQETMFKAIDAMMGFNVTKQLSTLTSEVLILAAELDRSYALNRLKKLPTLIPKASMAILPDCSHNAHLENEELFAKTITRFLTDNSYHDHSN